jgi:HAD superfamily hydrolase (TIGR01509 family)
MEPSRSAAPSLDVVFLDVGGVMYSDAVYSESLFRALLDLGAEVSDDEFAREYEACRAAQAGSFRRRIAARFLGSGPDVEKALQARASLYWTYPPEALQPDVVPCLEALRGRYRLGVIANQPSAVREAMTRDGIDGYFDVWEISDDLGLEKPDTDLFRHALATEGVRADRAVMVGDRLDYDVRPAAEAGMRTVWVLRGEAPVTPTPGQLSEPDATVRHLGELPDAIRQLDGGRG